MSFAQCRKPDIVVGVLQYATGRSSGFFGIDEAIVFTVITYDILHCSEPDIALFIFVDRINTTHICRDLIGQAGRVLGEFAGTGIQYVQVAGICSDP